MATKTFLRALNGETVSPPPIWLMRQAGRYLPEYRKLRGGAGSFLDLCYAPDLAVEVSLQPIRRFDLDVAILFSDILVVPHGLGQDVRFVENEGPKLAAIRSVEAVRALNLDAMVEHLAPVYQTVAGLAAALPRETALIGFAGAPWTVASYMVEGGGSREFAEVKGWAYRDPEGFGELIYLLVAATVAHLCAQVRAGAEAVQIFDSWAGVLPEAAFRRWIIEPTRELVTKFKALCPGVPIIGFPRGAGLMYPDYIRETGVSAVSLDTTVPTAWAAQTLQSMVPVQGNLDPLALLTGGACLEQGVRRILDDLAGRPFVFNLGHGVVKETPPERVAELVALVRKETA